MTDLEYDMVSKIVDSNGNVIYITSAPGVHQCILPSLNLKMLINVSTTKHTHATAHLLEQLGVCHEWYPFKDKDNMKTSHYMLRQAREIYSRVKYPLLINCAMGVSRSVSIAMYILMRNQNITANEALSQIRTIRPCAYPNESFLQILRTINPIFENVQDNVTLFLRFSQQPVVL